MPTISAHQLGQRRPLFADYAIELPGALDGIRQLTLAELLESVVSAEVAAFVQHQSQRRLLQVLTDQQIAAGLKVGKLTSGGSEVAQSVDEAGAIANVLQAFADGLFLVVLDGAEVPALDCVLQLNGDSRIAFVRLTALVGG